MMDSLLVLSLCWLIMQCDRVLPYPELKFKLVSFGGSTSLKINFLTGGVSESSFSVL